MLVSLQIITLQNKGRKNKMDKMQIMGILAIFLVAGIGIVSAQGWGAQTGYCNGDCEDPKGIQGRQTEREAIHQAVLDGDWKTFSSLTSDHNGPMDNITEEAFPKLTEIAVKMEEVRVLREDLAEELGVDAPGPRGPGMGLGKMGFLRGENAGFRRPGSCPRRGA